MLIDIELVGVCWCSVNMTVIFHKILNPTANLSQLVCWRLSVRCELALNCSCLNKTSLLSEDVAKHLISAALFCHVISN